MHPFSLAYRWSQRSGTSPTPRPSPTRPRRRTALRWVLGLLSISRFRMEPPVVGQWWPGPAHTTSSAHTTSRCRAE